MDADRAGAWASVAAGFLATFTAFGVAYSFGAFFGPMAEEFGAGSGATSAVFSITAFLYFVYCDDEEDRAAGLDAAARRGQLGAARLRRRGRGDGRAAVCDAAI